MEWKKLLYDFKSYETYGGGGYWKFNKQRLINIIIFGILTIMIVINVLYFLL